MKDIKVLEKSLAGNHVARTEQAEHPYREFIGSLMFLMIGTRPDLPFAVGKLSQFFDSFTSA